MGDWDNMLTGVLAGMGALSQGVNAGLSRMHQTDLMRMAEEANKARDAARFEAQRQRDEEQRAERRRRDVLSMEPLPTAMPGTPEAMMQQLAQYDAGKPSSLNAETLAPNAPPVTPEMANLFGVDLAPRQRVAPYDPAATQQLAAQFNDATKAYIDKGDVTLLNRYRSGAAGLKANQQTRLAEALRANTLAGQDAFGKWLAANPNASQPQIDSAVAGFTTYYGLPQGAIPAYNLADWKKALAELGLNAARARQANADAAKTNAETPNVKEVEGWMQANRNAYATPEALARAAALKFNMGAVSDELAGAARGFYTLAQQNQDKIKANKALLDQRAQNQADLQEQKGRDALMQAISTALVKNYNFDQSELPETMLMVRTLTSDEAELIYASLDDRANGKPLNQIRADLRDAGVNQQVIDTIFSIQAK